MSMHFVDSCTNGFIGDPMAEKPDNGSSLGGESSIEGCLQQEQQDLSSSNSFSSFETEAFSFLRAHLSFSASLSDSCCTKQQKSRIEGSKIW